MCVRNDFMITPDGRGSCRQDGRPRRHCAHAARRRVAGVTNCVLRLFFFFEKHAPPLRTCGPVPRRRCHELCSSYFLLVLLLHINFFLFPKHSPPLRTCGLAPRRRCHELCSSNFFEPLCSEPLFCWP